MIDDLIENLENDEDAILLHPVTSQSLAATQGFLLKNELPKVPDDYIDFLRVTNGLVYKRSFFYGTNEIEEEKLPALISINEQFSEDYGENDLLVLGSDRHSFFVFNKTKEMYEILDKENLELIEDFDDFEDMLMEFCDNLSSFREEDDNDYSFEDDYED